MKYDDAEYCFLNFETDRLPNEAGGTHMGMYLAWAASKDLLDWDFDQDALAPLLARRITGSQLFFDRCDGKLTDDDFNDVGNAFTASYYEANFVADYERVFADQIPNGGRTTEDFCSVPDTWENYDRLAPVLDQRFAQWRQVQAPSPPQAPAATPTPVPPAAAPTLALLEDPAEAVEQIRARAVGGDDQAWFELGVEYITGERVPRDTAKAADAFTRGADRGEVSCQFNLGVCFQHGDGRPRDAAKALHWFSQAANAGHADGLFQLAMAYRTGSGMPQDPVAANALVLLAQSRGSAEARREGITAGTLLDSTQLLEQIRQPGQLLRVLARRRTGGDVLAHAGTPPSPRPASVAPAPTVGAGDAGDAGEGRVGGAAVIALMVGALGFILLLLATTFAKGAALQAMAGVLGAVAAFGAYRCSLGLGKSTGMAVLLAAMAFVPVLGAFVCLALVLQIYRQRDSR